MPKTFELVIRDGKYVTYSAAAAVPEDFDRDLFDAYRTLYPDSPDDETLFYRIVQGVFQGIAYNLRNFQLTQPPPIPKVVFEFVGHDVRAIEPKSATEDKSNDE